MRSLKQIEWSTTLALVGLHLVAIVVVSTYLLTHTPSAGLIAAAVAVYLFVNIGITAGYHRLYAHRCYEIVSAPVEWLVLAAGTMAFQQSVLRWSHDHRRHHAFVDTDDDPYSINKGFWYAHFLWMTEKARPIDERFIPDLVKSPLLQFQARHHLALAIALNAAVVIACGLLFHDMFGAIALVLFARMILTFQSTWFVNSLAHFWGSKPFSDEHTAVNNWIVAVLTGGEGYHNFHHTFPNDYRNGVRWYQWDPTKLVIWGLGKLRLARDLRKVDVISIRRRMLSEDGRRLKGLFDQWHAPDRQHWESLLREKMEEVNASLTALKTQMAQYRKLKWDGAERRVIAATRLRVRALKLNCRAGFVEWRQICAQVLRRAKRMSLGASISPG